MTRHYLGTSAAAKLLVIEAETPALITWADGADIELVATHLLETELRRFGHRHQLPPTAVTEILDRTSLYDMPPSLFREAGILSGPTLRSLGALHLIGAIRLDVDSLITYDRRLTAAAADARVAVLAPGAS